MHPKDAQRAVKKLLDGLSDLEVREVCVAALRGWHAKKQPISWADPEKVRTPSPDTFSLHGELARNAIPLLAQRKGVTLAASDMEFVKEVFINSLGNEWMTGVIEFVWWFQRAGFASEIGARGDDGYPIRLRLTQRGLLFLGTTEDHPLLPGFLERVRARCPGVPDDVVALLNDAKTCMDNALLRPAIVLMGVAYEVAIEAVAESLVTKNQLAAVVLDQSAARRIAAVKSVIDVIAPGNKPEEKDRRFAAHAAFEFADQLRRRRNDASHTTPTYAFDDREETEEFLVSAGRHLPALWSLGQ